LWFDGSGTELPASLREAVARPEDLDGVCGDGSVDQAEVPVLKPGSAMWRSPLTVLEPPV